MQPVRVNVAVLSVAQSAGAGNVALENIVADRLTEGGHLIASFEAVRDSETAIRSQLVGWLADPEIDVVLVIGEGEATAAALKPMVDQPLPGFADLLRMLAYQEIGASAMLSTAEAARCGTTFVFVVPGNENAVKAAMDKLILPQLDPKTKPRNLIASMPRLRDAVDHDMTKVDVGKLGEINIGDVTRTDNAKMESARIESAKIETSNSVPTPIKPEKTATGAGVQPKLPAGNAPAVALAEASAKRPRQRTGVHVIVRKVEDPTKPIEIQKLEQQLALSMEEEATRAAQQATTDAAAASINTRVTKPIIPTIAPAARANIATRPLDAGNLRAPATPSGQAPVAKTLPSIVKKPAATEETSFEGIGDETKPLDLTKPTTPAATTESGPGKPSAKQQTWPKRVKPADVGDATKPMDLGRLPKLPPGAETQSEPEAVDDGPDADTGQIIALAAKPAPVAELARIPLRKVTPQAAAAVAPPATSNGEAAAAPEPTPVPTTPAPARTRQPTPPPPLPGYVVPRKKVVEENVETLDLEPDAEPASAAPTVVVEDDDPEVASSRLLDPPPTKRRPTQPPPHISELINVSPSTSLNELPAGTFNYPAKRPSKLPLILLLLLLSAAVGGGAMWFFNREKDPPKRPEQPVAQPTVEIDASEPVVAVVEVDAAEPAPIVVEPTPPDAAEPAQPAQTKPTQTKPAQTKPAQTKPTTEPPPEKPEKPEKPAVVAEPGCEEVACVLEKYARPCCQRFKPQGEMFQPGSADLSKAQIKAGVDKLRPRVIACSEQHKDVKGTVKVAMSVDPEGNVTELSVQSAPADGLGECVASALRRAKFAKTKNGGSFTYPFVF
ncbi:MAG: molybdopterin-binding protein [Myxococcota bacterium]|nr:molybdopterin-binding protein [Myxococcota bacterium]